MHLAINSLIGYKMAAMDGKIGKLEDFYFDDQVWIIVYLIVKTGNWLSGRKVLISPVVLIKGAGRDGAFPVTLLFPDFIQVIPGGGQPSRIHHYAVGVVGRLHHGSHQ